MTTTIRLPQAADLVPLTDLYNHYIRETTITFDLEPYSPEQRQRQWLEHYAPAGPHRLWIAERQGQVVGYASSSALNRKAAYSTSVETSIYLAPDCHRQGIGKMLYEQLFASLAAEDVHRAYAGITQPNLASEAFHRSFGFEAVGRYGEVGRKFGRYWDVVWFEKALAHS
ncbi:MAG: N-acetyltransferase [Synechococcales cyanobacterium RM1_1_8]|nr:N-acetyltransferase [Synechococcales cyanobacterium RM1_1_8]